jgi:hypothetical protein
MQKPAFKVKKPYESVTKRINGNAGKRLTANDCTAMVPGAVCDADHA